MPVVPTTTTMPFSSTSSRTMDSSPTLEPPSDKDKPDTPVIIGAGISVSILLMVILIAVIACVILWMKKKDEDQKRLQTRLNEIKPEKYAVPEDKPNKCAADQKTSDTGAYADIHVEENDHPLPSAHEPCGSTSVFDSTTPPSTTSQPQEQPPPPPYEPVELKQVSNLHASVTVIPAGVKVDDKELQHDGHSMNTPTATYL